MYYLEKLPKEPKMYGNINDLCSTLNSIVSSETITITIVGLAFSCLHDNIK